MLGQKRIWTIFLTKSERQELLSELSRKREKRYGEWHHLDLK